MDEASDRILHGRWSLDAHLNGEGVIAWWPHVVQKATENAVEGFLINLLAIIEKADTTDLLTAPIGQSSRDMGILATQLEIAFRLAPYFERGLDDQVAARI